MLVIKDGLNVDIENIEFLAPDAALDSINANSVPYYKTIMQYSYNNLADSYLVGAWLQAEDNVFDLFPLIKYLPLIALEFKTLNDGRPYSQSYLLRKRLNFQGDILAFGDFGKDQIFYLKRSGFNMFAPANIKIKNELVKYLDDLSVCYQSSIDDLNSVIWQKR
jgi:uncharacterized protein (DUF934 family)